MKRTAYIALAPFLIGLFCLYGWYGETRDAVAAPNVKKPAPIAPAKSTKTGLLLEPPLDLSSFTREKFVEMSSTIGADKIQKKWTSPVVRLPEHARANVKGLSHAEVKEYMLQAKRLIDQGKAIPVSDVSLISSQEDAMRTPALNHICGFENSTVRVYLLTQRIPKSN